MCKLDLKIDDLWQRPKENVSKKVACWCDAVPVGKDTLGNIMKSVSEKSDLSMLHTNHCIRATVVTNLDHQGVESHRIMATTGHKNEGSIKSYARRCPPKKHHEVSDLLAHLISDVPPAKIATTTNLPAATSTISTSTDNPEVVNVLNNTAHQKENRYTEKSQNENSEAIVPYQQIFGDDNITEDQILEILTQIEKENSQLNSASTQKNTTETNVTKTINLANINCQPMMPSMYFTNSTVTINYNIKQ